MNVLRKLQLAALALLAGLFLAPLTCSAEDIDIFVGSSGGSANNANVLIVLDNTTNWNRQSQHWPGQITQAQAEINAIKTVVASLDSNVNVGLMLITPNGTGNRGGYIRSAVKQMNDANKTALMGVLTTMYNNYNDEGVAANASYGDVLFDVFKYFGGYTSPLHATDGVAGTPTDKTHFGTAVFNDLTPAAKADVSGYTNGGFTAYSTPISTANSCSKSYIIFIGNGFPNSENSIYLSNVGGDTTSMTMPVYTTTATSTTLALGLTSACYSNLNQCVTTDYAACTDGTYASCSCSSSSTSSSGCASNKLKYTVQGVSTTTTATPTGAYAQPVRPRLADEWSRFLYQTDVNGASGQQNVSTYAIDVYNAQQDADQTALLLNMAKVGGGKYFAATDENKIVNALKEIFAEIQAVNTTFASTSLPVNATNRSQTENQVFIGMFRPDPDARPRWFGNLKRYQLIESGGAIELGDVSGALAINSLTGFITNCAASYWTTDSGTYWQNIAINPSPVGACTTTSNSVYSDLPDGPQVEKGAVAEVLRKGNNPPSTNTTPTWAVNRTLYTVSGNALTAFTAASSGLSGTLVNFISGMDVEDDTRTGKLTVTRPAIHGDVIHSRPLPVNYGGSNGVVVYYGANDGTLRAVEADTGKEKWALIAPEFFPRLQRLLDNKPLVSYPNLSASTTQSPTPKDYFFDGTVGLYQNADNSKVWIFPSMRRGGRMIYGLNVTNPNSPSLKWRVGCPNLNDDNGCTSDISGIGQTWSVPRVGFIKGFSTSTPVLVVGGGYDPCEDTNSASPGCGSAKGRAVYVLNADTGEVLKSFATERSVVGDASYVDIDGDGYPDYAYVADTGGNIYRISFIDNQTTRTPLAPAAWTHRRVAYTNGAGRKFLFEPSVVAVRHNNSNYVYIAIGSGDREHPLQTHYPYSSVTNRFYVYLDDLATLTGDAINMDSTDSMADYTSPTSCEKTPIMPGGSKKGWFMSLNANGAGEQAVTSALIAGGMVTFSTNRPVPAAAGTCSTTLGEARGYWVNLLNASGAIDVSGACGGSRSATFVGGGLPPSPVITRSVRMRSGNEEKSVTVVLGAVQKKASKGPSAPIAPQRIDPPIKSKRKQVYFSTKSDN